MITLVLVIHVMIAVALIVTVLLQRSEGGALGMGGGAGGGGGLMSGRGATNLLTRTTAILAASFMATSIILAILHSRSDSGSVLEAEPLPQQQAPLVPAAPAVPAVPAAPEVPVGN